MALPPIFIQFLGDYTGLKESADGVKAELAEVDAESTTSLEGLGAVSTGVLLGIGAAAVGAAYEGTKLAVSFQQAMTQISTQAQVPKSEIAGLSNDVLNLAGQVGFSPDSLAQALYHVESSFGSVGVTSTEAMSILKTAAQGAAVGQADLTDVTNALDAAIASGIPGVQNYSQAMGALNAIVGSGDMTMQDLADAMGTGVLAVVKGYGLSLNDVGAALDTFGDNNIRGAQAATDLRMAVQAMETPVTTAGPTLAKLGLSANTLAQTMQNGGLLPALELLNNKMTAAGMNGKEMSQTLTDIVGKKAGSGLDVLIGQLSRVQSKYPLITDAANSFGDAVAQQNDTMSQHIADLKASLDSLGVRIGDAVLPPLTKFLGVLSEGMSFLASHMDVFRAMAVGLGAVTAALIVAKVAAIDFDESLLANPIVWIVALIAALAAGIYLAYEHFKGFRDAVQDVWHALETASAWFDKTVIHNKELDKAVAEASKDIQKWWGDCWTEVGKAITWFENGPLKDIQGGIAAFESFWHAHGQEIMTDAKIVWNMISSLIALNVEVFVGAIKFGLALTESIWTTVWDAIRDAIKLFWDLIANIFETGTKIVLDIVGAFLDLINGRWSKLGSDAKKLVSDALHGLSQLFNQFTSDALKFLEDAGENLIKGLVNGIKSGLHFITGAMGDVKNSITGGFNSLMKIFSPSRVMYESGEYVIAGLNNSLVDGAQKIHQTSANLGRAIVSGFNSGPNVNLGALSTGNIAGNTSLGTSGGYGGGVVQNVVQLQVEGHVLTDTDLRDLIQQEMLKLGGRNMATYPPAKI